jgi:1,4-alpha-glucan branching enzyme
MDCEPGGFEWIDANDADQSVLTFVRRGGPGAPPVIVAMNFTPVVRHNYIIGVPRGGPWREILNSDATVYGGSGVGNLGGVEAMPVPRHGCRHSLCLMLPPLAIVFLRNAAAGRGA